MKLALHSFFGLLTVVVTLLSLYCVLHSFYTKGFLWSYIPFTKPIGMNVNYFAILVDIAIIYLVNFHICSHKKKYRLGYIGIGIFLFLILLNLTSRMAILALFLVSLIYIYQLVHNTKKYCYLLFPCAFIVVGYLGLSSSHFGKGRLNNVLNSLKPESVFFEKRIEVYISAIEAIKEKPLWGYGIAGSQRVLNKKYIKYGYMHQFEFKYHAHNQYLQFALYRGIGLIILLILVLFFPIFLKRDKKFFIGIMTVFLLTFITDSPLTDWRILFIFIFISFFLFGELYSQVKFFNNKSLYERKM